MFQLAQDKGGSELQDAFTISHNTVMTHGRCINRKLDVHSQLELIDLVGSL